MKIVKTISLIMCMVASAACLIGTADVDLVTFAMVVYVFLASIDKESK